jgi:protocatechuate 3,4-dioxygenase beta subunit
MILATLAALALAAAPASGRESTAPGAATVRGRVVDGDGRPLPGAVVTAIPEGCPWPPSDEPPAPIDLSQYQLIRADPVTGSWIKEEDVEGRKQREAAEREKARCHGVYADATSAKDGAFRLAGAARGKVRLRAVLKGGSGSGWSVRGVSATLDVQGDDADAGELRLPRAAQLAGVVRDPAGRPLAGVEVAAFEEALSLDEAVEVLRETRMDFTPGAGPRLARDTTAGGAVTGRDGRFRIEGIGPSARAFMLGWAGIDRLWAVGVAPGDEVALTFRPPTRIRGQVVDVRGRSVDDFLVDVDAGWPMGAIGEIRSGRFEAWLGKSDRERGHVDVHSEGVSVRVPVRVREGELADLGRIVLRPQGPPRATRRIRLRVLDAVTGAEVDPVSIQPEPAAAADAEGIREVDVARQGGTIAASSPEHRRLERAVGDGESEVVLRLVPDGKIVGRVLGGDGAPLGAAVACDGREATSPRRERDGEFLCDGLAAGSHHVTVSAAWIRDQEEATRTAVFLPREVEVAAGATARVEFRQPARSATLRVTFEDPRVAFSLAPGDVPPPTTMAATVALPTYEQSYSPPREPGVVTFPGIPPGTYTLFALWTTVGGTRLARLRVELPAGGATVSFTPPADAPYLVDPEPGGFE